MTRGILKPTSKLTGRDLETYESCNQSSFLNQATHDQLDEVTKRLNKELAENTEQRFEIEFEQDTINYKEQLIKAYIQVMDPFSCEIID